MAVDAGGEQDGSGGGGAGGGRGEQGERRRRQEEEREEREREMVGFVVWTGEGCFRKMSCGRFSVKTTRVHDFSLLHVEIKFTTGT